MVRSNAVYRSRTASAVEGHGRYRLSEAERAERGRLGRRHPDDRPAGQLGHDLGHRPNSRPARLRVDGDNHGRHRISCSRSARSDLPTSSCRAGSIGDDDLRSVFGLILLINAACLALLCALAPAAAWFYGEPRLVALLQVASLMFVASALQAIPRAMLGKETRFEDRVADRYVDEYRWRASSFCFLRGSAPECGR